MSDTIDTADIWAIGDLQGCREPLERLLAHPALNGGKQPARYWFAGDLVNRGPDSAGTLRTVIALGDRAVSILGNHDLHLLGLVAGVRKPGRSDTLESLLAAPDAEELIHWLRHRPLAHFEAGHLMVHAGVLPSWSVADTLARAAEVEAVLRGKHWREGMKKMFGNEPLQWRKSLTGGKRLRTIVNALTRLRMATARGEMDFDHKGAPVRDGRLMPWFDVPGRATAGHTVIFGHWSTLGLMTRDDAICLDTGCAWGGQLTALRLRDRQLVQVPCVPD